MEGLRVTLRVWSREGQRSRGGSVGAVITVMRAGPGGSTEQKRTHTAVERSRGRPTPTTLWERAGTSCPRSQVFLLRKSSSQGLRSHGASPGIA